MSFRILEKKIDSKKAKICIMGLGYVGLPLVVEFLKKGYLVDGFDSSIEKIEYIKKSKKDVSEVSINSISKYLKTKKLKIFSDPELIS